MPAKGSPRSLEEPLCLLRGLSLMAKPARQKRWMARGGLQGQLGKMSRHRPRPPSGLPGLPEDFCPAAPVRTSPL